MKIVEMRIEMRIEEMIEMRIGYQQTKCTGNTRKAKISLFYKFSIKTEFMFFYSICKVFMVKIVVQQQTFQGSQSAQNYSRNTVNSVNTEHGEKLFSTLFHVKNP